MTRLCAEDWREALKIGSDSLMFDLTLNIWCEPLMIRLGALMFELEVPKIQVSPLNIEKHAVL